MIMKVWIVMTREVFEEDGESIEGVFAQEADAERCKAAWLAEFDGDAFIEEHEVK